MPKNLWRDQVLPEMGARMGISVSDYNLLGGFSFQEQHAILNSGIYSVKPQTSLEDWKLLNEYIISVAPDSLKNNQYQIQVAELSNFEFSPVDVDSSDGSSIMFAKFDTVKNKLNIADTRGRVFEYDKEDKSLKKLLNGSGPISSFIENDSIQYVTSIGSLSPTEIVNGRIFEINDNTVQSLPIDFHRPVHTSVYDFDEDGIDEILVCEYGNLTGSLSLISKSPSNIFKKKILLGQPGTIRTIVRDMNGDGKSDIVVMTAQGNEGVSILYQTDSLNFKSEQVIHFSPVYGSSWFEMVDYDNDGDQDIITVHGDNADKTPVLKPYHGMRIHLNDGANNFEEIFFFPLNGATRSVSADFDQDGDIDFGLISTFPDYKNHPEMSFVYLENVDQDKFRFETKILGSDFSGRWFLIDSGDFDQDGDIDIALSCATFNFTAVPSKLAQVYEDNPWDMLILENLLIN
ncbi:FG-GAP repeat domain-containing protein [Zobellia roscoffensis]|uniref:FG-GAP repeat domain-containing protein n=1 Tax=Zobellia roscoffensis TaxID=2779508 RepID=UPI00188BDE75|nr:VCBS repeat-containing protein [Zobellia roscoffensis]